MEEIELPPVGATVEIVYNVTQPGATYGNETSITIEVDEHTSDSFVGGAGIGTKFDAHSDQVYGPTSSDGFHADGDERLRVGMNASWEVVEE